MNANISELIKLCKARLSLLTLNQVLFCGEQLLLTECLSGIASFDAEDSTSSKVRVWSVSSVLCTVPYSFICTGTPIFWGLVID